METADKFIKMYYFFDIKCQNFIVFNNIIQFFILLKRKIIEKD